MKVNYAEYEARRAYLSTDFGAELAQKKFGLTPEQLEERCGRYVRGARKGKLKGSITWHKVCRGGWVKTGAYDHDEGKAHGFVAKNGVCFAFCIESGDGETIAEKDVIWNHSREGKTLNVWGSYQYSQDKINYERQRQEEERRAREEAAKPQPIKLGAVIKKVDGELDVAFLECFEPVDIFDKIGQEITLTCIIKGESITGNLERISKLK